MRIERDLAGEREIPDAAFDGVHTLSALENFPVSSVAIATNPGLSVGLARLKHAAAPANFDLGSLSLERCAGFVMAYEHFPNR